MLPVADRQERLRLLRVPRFICGSAHAAPSTGKTAIAPGEKARRPTAQQTQNWAVSVSADGQYLYISSVRGGGETSALPPFSVLVVQVSQLEKKTNPALYVFCFFCLLVFMFFVMDCMDLKSTVMQPEDFVRQHMQFYYVVSLGKKYSANDSILLMASDTNTCCILYTI